MIKYKLYINPDQNPKQLHNLALYDLTIDLKLNNVRCTIDATILTNQNILENYKKFKPFVIKNKIISLTELLDIQLLWLDKYVEKITRQALAKNHTILTDEEILEIVEEKLFILTRDFIDTYNRFDDLLIRHFAFIMSEDQNYDFDYKYKLAMLIRTIFMYQLKECVYVDYENYKEHIDKMKDVAIKQFVNPQVCDELFDEILESLVESYLARVII